MFYKILVSAILLSTGAFAQKMELYPVKTNTIASFRGLSVVDDSIAWVSGSKGWVGLTSNGGKDWSFSQVKDFEKSDFRSLYAFDARHAVIANAGSPAYVLSTADGGASWQKVYENTDSAAFIDGMDFRDEKHGIIYGDPIKNRMLMLNTEDGGTTWKEFPVEQRPLLDTGEASFAASGTCIKYFQNGDIMIATGGRVSRLWVTKNKGKLWETIRTPIIQGQPAAGIFSFLPLTKQHWIIAGGNYMRDTARRANLFYTRDGGKVWKAPKTTTRGYRECLTQAADGTLYAVGTTGIDESHDEGNNWSAFSDEKQLHVMKKSRKGNLMIVVGGNGKVAIVKPE